MRRRRRCTFLLDEPALDADATVGEILAAVVPNLTFAPIARLSLVVKARQEKGPLDFVVHAHPAGAIVELAKNKTSS